MDKFKDRLKTARKLRGLTQKELAQKAGITQAQASIYESGKRKPSLDVLIRLADGLGIRADHLLGRQESARPLKLKDLIHIAKT